jgi:hypothetical protein
MKEPKARLLQSLSILELQKKKSDKKKECTRGSKKADTITGLSLSLSMCASLIIDRDAFYFFKIILN